MSDVFGFVKIYKDLLRVRDYNVFRGYYCGLCRELGRRYNQFTRLGLSYDMTFLAILISSLESNAPKFKKSRCIVHPLTKRAVCVNDRGISYSADMSVLLTFLKLKDEINDEHKFTSYAAMPLYYRSFRKAAKKHPMQLGCIKDSLAELSALEKSGCRSADIAADCFGRLLEGVFDIDGNNPALARLGFLTGRFIYIIDAAADIEDDVKKGCYNPFAADGRLPADIDALKKDVRAALLILLKDISDAYDLIDIKKNKELLDNIIYLGMREAAENGL